MRTLDLSKQEISLLLLQEFLRLKAGQFKSKVSTPELLQLLGTNFENQKFPKEVFTQLAKNYDQLIFEKGFTFEEQFKITQEMDALLKNNLKLWGIYFKLIEKMDTLIKSNLLFKDTLNRLFPSPEIQLNWLRPTDLKK
jgi:hypothetical protein